jgi:septal ring factor EnvC (AmiA/AmiB activator)
MKLLQDLKDLPQIRQRLADAEAKLDGVAEIEKALEASLAEGKDLTAKLSEATGKLTALEAEKANISADFEAYKAKEGERNAAYAASIVAGTGIKPIATKAKETEGEKKTFDHLKGLDRAIAAHAAKH